MDTVAALKAHWDRLVTEASLDARMSTSVLTTLLSCYEEPHRRYHTRTHLLDVLDRIERLVGAGEPLTDSVAVRMAAWFHDAVYNPRAQDNEARSADLAERLLALAEAPPPLRQRVAQLVRMTAAHEPADTEERILADADLAVLASDAPAYRTYAQAIRDEYRHLDDERFRAGRAAFCRRMLARSRIFSMEAMAPAEQAARDNLAAELRELEAQTGGADQAAGMS